MLDELQQIARDAGAAIMEIYNSDEFDVQLKGDDSPLTKADLAAHRVICDGLSKLAVQYPIISEESADIDWELRKHWHRYWLVDPLDGTKEFIKRNGEFTVNIALIEKGEPVCGVVYAPVLDAMYVGQRDKGAFLNGQPIQVEQQTPETLRIVGSRSHASQETTDWLEQLGKPYEMVPMGSSLKICLVAEGKADIYPRLGPTSEWDTAAAHAVLNAAGGSLKTTDGKALRYNQKESFLNPYFIAE
ncbi:3'(2'),5'-bisphosphate nucleotidase CysQ [Idiomarina seosinensis]|uniref:3'(2'),5'-bisphosphate nucleotidase CysQ n=1 Tax=Idiomarina seosinensis TaxID=281739 RepID=A0A432ZGE6_9GAMM|nr:3'(2'),5'-bisphosphate nucleotidase CysQ [Idiomarina seosinensis]RUO76973.1 3'(2'),5'-bisphosphate nucleotidase [Idiomarina seosinensis]